MRRQDIHLVKWCEAIYNADGRYKYINPLIEDGNGSYLYAAQGSREEHRKWWLYNRFLYMDSKYNAGDFLIDYATMRLYTPQNWAGVEPNADFTITPFADQYVRVKYGSYIRAERCKKDVSVMIKAPDIQFNDTETIVYGASRIKSLGDLSGKYAGTIDMSKAVRLSELHIGSDVEGYHNDNLTVLSVGTNRMLRKLDTRNCPNLKQPIDVSGCDNLEELYAKGTSITTAVFAPAGILSKLQLPDTVTNLTLKNQSKLTDENFALIGVDSLTTIVLENVVLNAFALLLRSMESGVLQRIRMINVSGSAATADILYQIAGIGGIDENGYNIDRAVLTGSFHVATIREDKLAELGEMFPELEITYNTLTLLPAVTLSFVSSQGKLLSIPKFVCSLFSQKVNNTTFVVKGEINETFTYTFSALNHEDATGEVIITQQEETKEISATYIPMRTIKVLKRNTTIFIPGATIKIGDETYTSSAVGQVQIRKNVSLSGTVEANDYNDGAFEFEAIADDTTNTVYIDPCAVVTFTVRDEKSALLSGATVTIGGKSANTDSSGVCTIPLKIGWYSYAVKYQNCVGKGAVTVALSDMSVSASVMLDISPMKPEENGNIQLLLARTNATLDITSPNTDYVINWGDGTSENASGIGYKAYKHTYPNDEYYQVEVSNCAEVTSCKGSISCLIAYWSIGNSKVKDLSFYSCRYLMYVGLVFINDVDRRSFSTCFRDCDSLADIPSGLFDNCPNVTSFYSCFGRCRRITSIPIGLFDNCPNVTSFGDVCYGCSSLTSIPTGLFDNCPNVTDFSRCFGSCSSLTSIPIGLFDNCTAVTDFNYCFSNCRKAEQLPTLWILYYGKTTTKAGCFNECTTASNWQDVPKSWGGLGAEWYPPFDATITVKIIKDSAWWLNKSVVINDVTFTQLADRRYSAILSGINVADVLEVVINGSPQGTITLESNKTDYTLLIGDNSSLYSVFIDYTTGSIHEDSIVSNDGWAYSAEIGGIRSRQITGSQTTSFVVSAPAGVVTVTYGQNSESSYDRCIIYTGADVKVLDLKGGDYQGDNKTIEVTTTGDLKFAYSKDGSGDTGKDAFWIKKIVGSFTMPALPEDFIPSTPSVSGAMIADYRALNTRVRNLEEKYGII